MIGIDVSKDKLDVYISQEKKHLVIPNTTSKINGLLKRLANKNQLSMLVFEPTGCYSKELEVCCLKQDLPYHKVNLNKMYHFAKSTVGYAKTDKIDAALLADYGDKNAVEPSKNNSIAQIERQELGNLISSLKMDLAGLKSTHKGIYLNKTVKKYLTKRIVQMNKDISRLTEKLDELISNEKNLLDTFHLLMTIKGVGEQTARLMVTSMPELGSVSREQISALVGVAPYNRDSGNKTGYRAIIGGRFHVRNGLYMAALVASRYNPRMKRIYNDLLARGKKPKVALVALMRKMLIMMNAMVKNNQPWSTEI